MCVICQRLVLTKMLRFITFSHEQDFERSLESRDCRTRGMLCLGPTRYVSSVLTKSGDICLATLLNTCVCSWTIASCYRQDLRPKFVKKNRSSRWPGHLKRIDMTLSVDYMSHETVTKLGTPFVIWRVRIRILSPISDVLLRFTVDFCVTLNITSLHTFHLLHTRVQIFFGKPLQKKKTEDFGGLFQRTASPELQCKPTINQKKKKEKVNSFWRIWGFHGGEYEVYQRYRFPSSSPCWWTHQGPLKLR